MNSLCGGKRTTSERLFFSNGSSRKSFTSCNTYFVLLEQLASLSNEWSTLKKHPVLCLNKLSHLTITHKSYTNAAAPVCNIFQVFLD